MNIPVELAAVLLGAILSLQGWTLVKLQSVSERLVALESRFDCLTAVEHQKQKQKLTAI